MGRWLLLLLISFSAHAEIVGRWLTESKGEVEIYQEKGKYFGKIVGGEERAGTGGLDVYNPDPGLRKRKVLGLVVLKDMKLDRLEYNGGTIYDPDSGKSYKCMIYQKRPDELKLTGYVGMSLIGRTEVWRRIK